MYLLEVKWSIIKAKHNTNDHGNKEDKASGALYLCRYVYNDSIACLLPFCYLSVQAIRNDRFRLFAHSRTGQIKFELIIFDMSSEIERSGVYNNIPKNPYILLVIAAYFLFQKNNSYV